MIIDYHSHFIPPECMDFEITAQSIGRKVGWRYSRETGEIWINGKIRRLGEVAGQAWLLNDESPLWNVSARLPDMNRACIQKQVVSVPPYLCLYELDTGDGWRASRLLNEGIARGIEGADRFIGFATVPLQAPAVAARELEYAVTKLGLRGVEILTHVNGRNLDDISFLPFWEAVAGLNAPVFIHPHAPTDAKRLDRYYFINLLGNPFETATACAHLIFGGVLDRYPGLRFILSHAGGVAPFIFGRWEHGQTCIPECRTPKEPIEYYLKNFYFDTITHRTVALQFLIEMAGAEQVVFGTDYPYDMGDWDPAGSLKKISGLTDSDYDQIANQYLFCDNAG
jgi:aminocarboxymuconate-semialdehyde decarboxylase